MRLIFHGAAKEVGRSCIELKTKGDRIILDAGIKFKEHGFEYPEKVLNLPDIDGLFISHAHLDHTGALPMFEHNNITCPIFCTKLTYELTKILLKDSYKIARIRNLHPAYEKIDLKKVAKAVRFIRYDQSYKHRDIRFTFRNAGHIPGSAMMEIEAEGKRLLYTGDIKIKPTELMKGAYTAYNNVDTMIIESTYGNRVLPDKEDLKKRFLDRVEAVVKDRGSVLIPVFSLGRAQLILMILAERRFNVPVYYEGMCHKMNSKMLKVSDDPYIRNRKRLEKMLHKGATHISSPRRRQYALQKPGIFVTTSGMLQGGPVLSYIKELWHSPKNTIMLTGFQCKRTNGRHLYEEGFVYIDGWKTYVKCAVEKFDFSGHADQNELQEFIRQVNPKNLIIQHGDAEEVETLKAWAEKNTKARVYAPRVGDEIEV
ncbi:MBL fold metallo-hydrolase [Candidatus Woesearchaeota archaeon]|nr:MBL fold metallo-hydrolase [Candidatus Woesearchaeota archaeon]